MQHRHRFHAAGDAFWKSEAGAGPDVPAQTSTRLPAEALLRADSGQRTQPVLTSLKRVLKCHLVQSCEVLGLHGTGSYCMCSVRGCPHTLAWS